MKRWQRLDLLVGELPLVHRRFPAGRSSRAISYSQRHCGVPGHYLAKRKGGISAALPRETEVTAFPFCWPPYQRNGGKAKQLHPPGRAMPEFEPAKLRFDIKDRPVTDRLGPV